jgi:hypothetical protein
MLIIFFDIKGVVHKEFILAGQIVKSAYYCEFLWRLHENMRRLHPELWRQKNWRCITTTNRLTLPFSPGIFAKSNMTVVPHTPKFLFHRMKIKLKGRHFGTIQGIKAESQVMVNTLTEHVFQVAFKKWQKHWEQCIRAEEDYFSFMVASRPKFSF